MSRPAAPLLYLRYMRQFLLSLVEYRVDFLFGLASMFLMHLATLVFLGMVFSRVPAVRGYTFPEVAFVFGFSVIPQGVLTACFSNLFRMNHYVRMGELDRVLLRPLPALFQISASRFDGNGLGNLLVGALLVGWSWSKLAIPCTAGNLAALAVMLASATAVLVSIHLVVASTAFLLVENHVLSLFVNELDEFTYYPITIYNRPVRFALTFLVPLAFASFYPATLFLGRSEWRFAALATPAFALLFASVAYGFFLRCLERYESPGN